MIIPRKEDLSGLSGVPKGSIKDTKRAIVFATLGLRLDPVSGILVILPAGNKNRLDGEAYFTFNVAIDHFERVNRIYDAGQADIDLDKLLERLKTEPAYVAIADELERIVTDALIVYGRRFLENYQRLVNLLKDKGQDIEITEKPAGAYEFKFHLEKRR